MTKPDHELRLTVASLVDGVMTGNEKPTPALRIPTSANLDSWNLAEEGGSVGYLIEANAMVSVLGLAI